MVLPEGSSQGPVQGKSGKSTFQNLPALVWGLGFRVEGLGFRVEGPCTVYLSVWGVIFQKEGYFKGSVKLFLQGFLWSLV